MTSPLQDISFSLSNWELFRLWVILPIEYAARFEFHILSFFAGSMVTSALLILISYIPGKKK